ncbi:MAG: twin-arginine translocase TatA/TatE family subunit [Armatimonadota bacterium]|nr:twin-arginine translocase TatA/TatE family subunit [Armatimonadota bacterium]
MFGPSRLADIGSSLGKAVRDFRKAMQEEDHEVRGSVPGQGR